MLKCDISIAKRGAWIISCVIQVTLLAISLFSFKSTFFDVSQVRTAPDLHHSFSLFIKIVTNNLRVVMVVVLSGWLTWGIGAVVTSIFAYSYLVISFKLAFALTPNNIFLGFVTHASLEMIGIFLLGTASLYPALLRSISHFSKETTISYSKCIKQTLPLLICGTFTIIFAAAYESFISIRLVTA